jgi:hypothetical protein
MFLAIAIAAAVYALPPKVRGDFDHDGKMDLAEIVKIGGTYKVVVRPGSHPQSIVVVETLGHLDGDFFLDTARAGRWKTWCGKGGGSDHEPCPRTAVVLKGGDLTFGRKEASEWVAIWTGKRYQTVLLSD